MRGYSKQKYSVLRILEQKPIIQETELMELSGLNQLNFNNMLKLLRNEQCVAGTSTLILTDMGKKTIQAINDMKFY